MPRRIIHLACAILLLAVASPGLRAAPGDEVVAQCFGLRDSNPAGAVALAKTALASAGIAPDVEIKLRTCFGRALALTGDATAAAAEVERVDALLAQHPMSAEDRLRVLSNAGATLHTLGWTGPALAYYERAFDAAAEGDSDVAQASTLVNVASIHSEALGAYGRAEELYAQAAEAQARAGFDDPLLPYNRALNALRMGDRGRALALFGEAERIALAKGHLLVEQRARAERLALRAADGQMAQGSGAAVDLAAIAERQMELRDPSGAATTLLRLAALEIRQQDPDAALEHVRRASTLVDGPAFRGEQREARRLRVEALAARGDWREAYEDLQEFHAAGIAGLRQQRLDDLAGLQARMRDTARELEFQRLQDAQRIEALQLGSARRLRNVLVAAFVATLLLGGAFAWYQRRVNRRPGELSRGDPLTGLLNRRAAARRLEDQGPAASGDGRRDAVFLIDIDHFKARNDRYGHAAGDAALAEVARRLRACCRPSDIVARWGGEEFLVGCRQVDLARAQQVAERLRNAAAGEVPSGGDGEPLSVSVGFACFPFFPGGTMPGSWQDAVALADRALYAAKHAGRDAWVGIWGEPGGDAAVAAVLEDPEVHAARGVITVVASRGPVRWQAPVA